MEFKLAIDSTFLQACAGVDLKPAERKWVLSVLNDFEDGKWRTEKFQDFVWDNIADTALSAREREILAGRVGTQLRAIAKKLRLTDAKKDSGKGSELAEAVLYGILRNRFNALPVVPKIFYKQNANDYAKGADSVHIVLENDGDFTLWLGEAKFYKSISNASLRKVVKSVAGTLSTEKLQNENRIITSLSDLDFLGIPGPTKSAIRSALSSSQSIDALKPRLRIPILLLHECAITASSKEMAAEYIESVSAFHRERAISYFKKQVSQLSTLHKYSEIGFYLILFPVPCKKTLVQSFVGNAKLYKG